MNQLARDFVAGSIAGLSATAPMTAAMELMFQGLPWHEQQPLPPRTITMRAVRKTGIEPPADEDQRLALTLVSHFGYGTGMGGLYGAGARHVGNGQVPAAAKGVAYGLAVWAGSYLGLLPSLGLLSSATRHPARRNLLMIAAHIVWGAVLGVMTERLQTTAKEKRT
jgi:uncharacterized membrane protein YagU involved in acid resistance